VVNVANTQVLNVILATDLTATKAPVYHQATYQYVVQANQYHHHLVAGKLLAVLAAVADVLNVILSVVATILLVYHQHIYQYVDWSDTDCAWCLA
jgi:hypothetical protein